MALHKEIVFDNGVNISYHYISDMRIDGRTNVVNVRIDSYTDIKYRDIEKNNNKLKNEYDKLLTFIVDENKKEENERDVKKIESYSNELNLLSEKIVDNLDLKVTSFTFEFKDILDFRMSRIYTLLKKEDFFIGSDDI